MAFSDRSVSFRGLQPSLETSLSAHSGKLELRLLARKRRETLQLELHQGVAVLSFRQLEIDSLEIKTGLRHLADHGLPRLLRDGPQRASALYGRIREQLEPALSPSAFEGWLASLTEGEGPLRLAQHNDTYFLPAWVRLKDFEHAPREHPTHCAYLSLATAYWRGRFARSALGFAQTLEELKNTERHPPVLEYLLHSLDLPGGTPAGSSPRSRPGMRTAKQLLETYPQPSDSQFSRFVQRAGDSWAVADHPDFPQLHFPRRTLEGKVIHFRLQLIPDGPVFAWYQTTPPAWFAYVVKKNHAFVVPHQDLQAGRYSPPDEFIDALLRHRAHLQTVPLEPGLKFYPLGSRLLAELARALEDT